MKKTCIILCVLGMTLGAGCSMQQGRTLEPPLVKLDLLPSEDVSIRVERTYASENELVIEGKVNRMPNNCCDRTVGSLNLMVLDPGGQVVDMLKTSTTPRNIPKARVRSSTFTARFPYVLPKDFTVRIGFQRGSS